MKYALLFVAFIFYSKLMLLGQGNVPCANTYVSLGNGQSNTQVWDFNQSPNLLLSYNFDSTIQNYHTEVLLLENGAVPHILHQNIVASIAAGFPIAIMDLPNTSCQSIWALPYSYNLHELNLLFASNLISNTDLNGQSCCSLLNTIHPLACDTLQNIVSHLPNGTFNSILELAPLLQLITGDSILTPYTLQDGINIINAVFSNHSACGLSRDLCHIIDITAQISIVMKGDMVDSFAVFPYYTVWYPMTVDYYTMPPLYYLSTANNQTICQEDFSYELTHGDNLEFINDKGDFVVYASDYYEIKCCHKYQNDLPCSYMTIEAISEHSVAVDDLYKDNTLWQIYPNPTNGKLSFLYQANSDISAYRWSLIDISGRILMQDTFHNFTTSSTYELNIEHLAPGLYMLNIENNHSHTIQKIVKY